MSKRKIIIYNIFLFVLAAAIAIGFWAIGFVTADKKAAWKIVFAVSMGAIGLLCIINVVCNRLFTQKFKKMKVRELYEYMDDVRKKAQSDIIGVRKKTLRMVILSYFYLALIFALLCLCAFAYGKADLSSDMITIILLLFMYLFVSIFDILFLPISNDLNNLQAELSRDDFPLMHRTVQRAADAVGFKGNIRLFLVASEVTVTAYCGTAFITIGYKEAALFTNDELFAVMLHEFAHIINADVKRAKRLSRLQARWDSESFNNVTLLARILLFSFISQIVEYNIYLYNLFSSIVKEQAADDMVRRLDGKGSFADAIAKTEMIAKYSKVPVPELEYYFFESEVPPQHFATLDYNTYLEYCKKYGHLWRDELQKELPSQVDTHPTAKMRIQGFGRDVSDCNDSAIETDSLYVVEQQRILERADAFTYIAIGSNYAEQREHLYLERKTAIDNLDRAEANGKDLTGAARENALWALLGIDDDRTIVLADRMIASGDRAPAANFAKGYVYRRRHDDRCVECFVNAASDPAYAEEAYNLIGKYALMTGNEELIEKYRADIPDVMQTAHDKMEDNEFKSTSPTEPCDLDIAVIAELAHKINSVSDNALKKLYVSKYTAPDGNSYYPFAFDFTKKAALRANRDMSIYYIIYDILVSYNREPAFILCNPNMGLVRNVKRAKGLTVYDCINQTQIKK